MRLLPGVYFMRGSTAYEFQVWRIVLRVVHLRGGYWTRWHFWRRFRLDYSSEDF
jgi:hypothetical protein